MKQQEAEDVVYSGSFSGFGDHLNSLQQTNLIFKRILLANNARQ